MKPLNVHRMILCLNWMCARRPKIEVCRYQLSCTCIAISTLQDDETEVKVPMCGLLIGGDRFNIHQVYLALVNNQCPIVIVKVHTSRRNI